MINLGPCLLMLSIVSVFARENTYIKTQIKRVGPMVHLMEWPYKDIARECRFLSYWGYKSILISPPVEHVALDPPSWQERYMPVSLELKSRSGSSDDLFDMIRKCKANSNFLRVFVDLNFNNMLKSTVDGEVTGTSGSKAKPKEYHYSQFTKKEFNEKCKLVEPGDLNDASKVRQCEVDDMQDLNNHVYSVMQKHVKLMKKLYDMGVYGFRISMAKYMYPEHLDQYYIALNIAIKNTHYGEEDPNNGHTPMVIHDVNDEGTVKPEEYKYKGDYPQTTTDYSYAKTVSKYFLKHPDRSLDDILNLGEGKWLRDQPMVFLYNHLTQDTQDQGLIKRLDKMADKDKAKAYRMAMAFMITWPYGIPLVLSSYKGNGVPLNQNGTVKSPRPQSGNWWSRWEFIYNGSHCADEYNCEHSDPITARLAVFNEEVIDDPVELKHGDKALNWFYYTRGRSFIFFNAGDTDVKETVKVNLSSGDYCEIASGDIVENKCTGNTITVENGQVTVELKANDTLGYIAIHHGTKIRNIAASFASLFGHKTSSSEVKTAPSPTTPEKIPDVAVAEQPSAATTTEKPAAATTTT